ncbi:MAG TPA: NAD-dependent malic enzyme [Acidimicrobiales bacterium]|nr:NAD-dependent malic enzyme [Acidimicrobiales bacterium]
MERPPVETVLRGRQLLSDPRLSHGVAFTREERAALGLVGLLPPAVLTLDVQAARAYEQFSAQKSDLAKHVFLTLLHERIEVLYFRLLQDHLAEMLPIVYTPTVGEAIQHFSTEFRGTRGVYLSVDHPDELETSLEAAGLGADDVDVVVATDGEAILGIGDWGVGGIGISIGKLSVYTAAGGVDPDRTLPVVLDVGTNRTSLLDDPLYLGNRHPRVDTPAYDAFVDAFVRTATSLFPRALVHWEDLGAANAHRVLDRYKDDCLTFNDDIQGTGAIALAAVLAALETSGEHLCDQRVVIHGAGTAGIGIAEQLAAAIEEDGAPDGRRAIWALSSQGLLCASGRLRDFQRPFARRDDEVADWSRDHDGRIDLAEVVARVHPTVLIGTSGQAGSFSEEIVRTMASHCERPVVMPLSNPTSLSEADPADVLAWSDRRALLATGSPFRPVTIGAETFEIAQANNAFVFPGLGLGAIVAQASRITPGMLRAAAVAIASAVGTPTTGSPLLPPVGTLRRVSAAVAAAVAGAAVDDGVARRDPGRLHDAVAGAMWEPIYRPIRPAG